MELSAIKNKISSGISLLDETYDPATLSDCHLSIELSKDGIAAAVLDLNRNKYIALKTYNFQGSTDLRSASQKILNILDIEKLFKEEYKSISLALNTPKSTIVPNPLFDPEKKTELLSFNHSIEEDESVKVDDLKTLEAKNIYSVPALILEVLKKFQNKAKLIHHSTVLIEDILRLNKNKDGKKIFVHVQPSHFEIIITGDKKLIFYNSFQYQTSEDFIYYLLFACEQLKFNPENLELILIGQIERNSAIYSLLYKYIRNIKFGSKSESFEYSYKLKDLPDHFFYSLFSQCHCV
jgi:hypothetical protein